MTEQTVETLESLPDDDGFQKLWKTLQSDASGRNLSEIPTGSIP